MADHGGGTGCELEMRSEKDREIWFTRLKIFRCCLQQGVHSHPIIRIYLAGCIPLLYCETIPVVVRSFSVY